MLLDLDLDLDWGTVDDVDGAGCGDEADFESPSDKKDFINLSAPI